MRESKKKITRTEFIETIINNTDGKTNVQLAREMGISDRHFYNLQDEYAIRTKDEVKKYAQRFTSEMVHQLRKNAKNGSDRAVQLLLELSETYVPSNKLDLKASMNIEYLVGIIKTPLDAGLSPNKQVKAGKQKQLETGNPKQIEAKE